MGPGPIGEHGVLVAGHGSSSVGLRHGAEAYRCGS